MKNNYFKYFISIIIILFLSLIYLSVIGIETDKFNNQIKSRIKEINKNFDLKINSVNLKIDPLNFQIKVKTIGATVFYLNKPLQLESIKTEISLHSFVKNKIISSKFKIVSRSILLSDLIKFVRTQNNSLELLIFQNVIKKGSIILDLNVNIDEEGKIKNDYLLTGILKDAKIEILKTNKFENINFNFKFEKNNYSFNNIEFKKNNVKFKSKNIFVKKKNDNFFIEGIVENKKAVLKKEFLDFLNINLKNLNIENTSFISKTNFSLELDKKLRTEKTSISSKIEVDNLTYNTPVIFNNYFQNLNDKIIFKNNKFKFDYNNNKISIVGDGVFNFNNKLNKIEYDFNKIDKNINFSSNIEIENIILKKQNFLQNFFPKVQNQINLKKHKVKLNIKDNNIAFSGVGGIKIEKDFENINYSISQIKDAFNFDIGLNLTSTNFKLQRINYEKKDDTDFKLVAKGNYNQNDLRLNNLKIIENKNEIFVNDLKFGKNSQIISLESAFFNFNDIENKKNKFLIQKIEKNIYKIDGSLLNAKSLITDLIENKNEKSQQIFKNNVNFIINLEKVYIDETYFVENLNGKVFIKNNKVEKAKIIANLKDKEKINLVIITDDKNQKITTLTSTWAKPLVNRYKFIKGFEEGYLDFYSLKKEGVSTSKLVIDNFKVKEIPALAKLLALASLQGIADLLTGEGIRFTDFEMNFTNQDKIMKIKELYAIGPAISILLEGYIDDNNLISLRGTLVPATTINRSIASIPLLGDLLIGKKVGDGVFGVSFKIKGPPKQLETTVNPIKTLTPRFITRTLEKIKKN